MKYTLFLSFIVLFGCQPTEESADLSPNTTTKSSASVEPTKWSSIDAFPLKINFGSDFNQIENNALESATSSWNSLNLNAITYFETGKSNFSTRNNLDEFKDGELGIYKIYNWPDDMPGTALAVTQIFGKRSSGGFIKIDHADILINYDFFDFSADDSSWGYDLETVVVHELGHLLGLYHENTSADHSVMYPTISRYRFNRTPHEHDAENLSEKYPLTISKSVIAEATSTDEEVVLVLELHADGTEVRRIK